jgi:hypothetical protein
MCGRSQMRKFEHDCFDWEDVWNQYEWYVLDPADTSRLATSVEKCPNPLSPACDCPVHKALRAAAVALPSSSWIHVLEADRHVHEVSLEMHRGVPKLQVKT